MEIFYPPFWYNFKAKPRIVRAPDLLQYKESFFVSYEGSSSSVQVICLTIPVIIRSRIDISQSSKWKYGCRQ